MSEESPAPAFEKKEKNWLIRILKIVFILSAFVLVGITVLANMGGSNDSLKDSVERFASELFQGRPAKVEKLVNMSFFPRLGFNAEGINILSNADDGYSIVEIGKVQVYMGFWNVAFRDPRVKQFYIEDFKAIKGAVGAKEFYIEKIFIDHDIENGKANLSGNGKIGEYPWSFKIGVNIDGSKGDYSYVFSKISPFTLEIADISTKATFISHEDGYFKFEDFKVIFGDIELKGDLVLSALGNRMLKLKGDVISNHSETALSPDLIFDYTKSPVKVEGALSSGASPQDDAGAKSILTVLQKLREVVGYQMGVDGEENYDWDALFDFSNVKIPTLATSPSVQVQE